MLRDRLTGHVPDSIPPIQPSLRLAGTGPKPEVKYNLHSPHLTFFDAGAQLLREIQFAFPPSRLLDAGARSSCTYCEIHFSFPPILDYLDAGAPVTAPEVKYTLHLTFLDAGAHSSCT
jgi:hypothetical protein